MSTLRQKRKDHVPTEDVEALIIQDVDDSAAPPSSPMRTSASHLRQNPIVIARMVLRKVGHLLMNDEDAEDITTAGGFIALLKDILIGLIFGMISVSALVFLDFKNVLHMQSAHNYRNMANAMLSDPETRKSVEESSGLHFMTVEDYQRKVNEIKQFPSQLTSIEEKSKKLVPDLEAAKKEYEAIKPDYDKLLADPLLGLDKFCGECSWQGRTSCDGRLSYVIDKYKKSKAESKLSMMESLPQCVKKE